MKRVPGSSGRVHKNTEGEWVWSDDEMKDTSNETAAAEPVNQPLMIVNSFLAYSIFAFTILAVHVLLPPDFCLHQLDSKRVN